MKKGFTLVELAIVLVVIGMILGMAIKGKSLIDAAKLRAELAKIVKFETAAAVYESKGKGPAANATELMTTGIFTEKDLKSAYNDNGYAMQQCVIAPNVGHGSLFAKYPSHLFVNNPGNIMCMSAARNPMTGFSAKFACYVEAMLDDKNPNTGDGQWYGVLGVGSATWGSNHIPSDPTESWFDNCSKLDENLSYLYNLI